MQVFLKDWRPTGSILAPWGPRKAVVYANGPEAPREGLFDDKRDRTAEHGAGLQKSTHLVFQ
jgi:hypothetical protein